jgi:DNA-binding NtrC family response regulator
MSENVPLSSRQGDDPGDRKRPRLEPGAVSPTTVLLVEDEESVREFVRVVLEQAGYEVVAVGDGIEGFERFSSEPHRFDLVLTDVLMPNRTGPELFELVRGIQPDARVLFMSAYTGGTPLTPIEMPHGVSLIEKPFSLDRLLLAVRQALDPTGNGPAT